jgi:hypothetical protein
MEYKLYKDNNLSNQIDKMKDENLVEYVSKTMSISTINKNKTSFYYSTPCLMCNESVRLTDEEVIQLEHGRDIHRKICDKCKQAVLHIRKQLDENNEN